MPKLENHPLARRQLRQRLADPIAQLPVPEAPLRIARRPVLLDRVRAIDMVVTAIEKRLLVWRPVAAMDAR